LKDLDVDGRIIDSIILKIGWASVDWIHRNQWWSMLITVISPRVP
jgi:ABC-type polysaccharide transport system permease subunit